ncbi:hypothetical protein PVBG_01358 [Plasmodium vivax Brazil I]|uniref:Uncharacterized protein n=1 Tax=Plasmodium vivax (strain Brazil I) TaxID=1033975 RepID=A0A0J9VGT3_PLAV1|nr:hypothetical protein PVBG_01358 [Plasmodium vivax Brazil I]
MTKKLLKKKTNNKYVYRFIIFVLVPFFGLLIPLLFNKYGPFYNYCVSDCKQHGNAGNNYDHKDTEFVKTSINGYTWKLVNILNNVFLCISILIVVFFIIYIFIKVIKYQSLKSGKGKMSVRDYCHFCKELIR